MEVILIFQYNITKKMENGIKRFEKIKSDYLVRRSEKKSKYV